MARKIKLDFVPSEYQQKIFDWVQHGVGNAVIQAFAGSAKTTTAVASMKFIPKDQKCLFIAFNKSIADELNERLKGRSNCTARTTHSLGFLMIRRNLGSNIEVDEYKYRNYVKQNILDLTTTQGEIKTRKQILEYIDNITKLIDYSRFYLAQSEKEINEVAQKYDIPVSFDECVVAQKCLEWGKENYETIDYTDMIWLPVELSLKPIGCTYDWVFFDEIQDASMCSIQLFQKCIKRGGRFMGVGDFFQCQPIGTKILTSDGNYKNIEDIKIGEELVTYRDKDTCNFKGYKRISGRNPYASKVKNIEHHTHNGKIVTVFTDNGLKSSYTQDHLCYAKFNREKSKGKYVLYLMCNKDNMFRMGVIKLFNNSKTNVSFGLTARMRSEKCYKGWILKVFDNEKDARLAEIEYSTIYRIPQTIFKMKRAGCTHISDEEIIELYSNLNKKYNMLQNAIELLEYFDKRIEYPLHILNNDDMPTIGGNKYRNGREYLSNYYACNLLPEVMDVACYDENNNRVRPHGKHQRSDWYRIPTRNSIVNINVEEQNIEVYSLEVENEHNYVADGIVTHNCIYAFAGSSEDAFNTIKNLPNTTLFELPISYRCAKNIIELANTFVSNMCPRDNAPDGIIVDGCHIKDIKEGDMVLCRSRAPLMTLYNKLIRKNINCYIKGQDIGTNLIKELESVNCENLGTSLLSDGVFVRLFDKLFNERNKLMQTRCLDFDDATLSSYIMEKYDALNAMLIMAERCRNKQELINHIKQIFQENSEGVCLSTIHKAKGLEAENVYILCHSSMPSKLAVKDWEKIQEKNLMYVAYTRAKNKLGFISEKEIKPTGALQDPMLILNEMVYIESCVCRVLNKTPMERITNTEVLKMKLQYMTPIEEDTHKNDNVIDLEKTTNIKNDDLLCDLEKLI